MENVITVKNLTKKYNEHTAVEHLSFEVKKGEIFGLLGANGAGKSTTIECILGTRKFDEGEVRILDMDPIKDRKKVFEQVGVQFQEAKYQDLIKVREVCEITGTFYKQPKDYKQLLKAFGIEDKENAYVKDLSGGQRQRLFIVLALIPNPKLVFLDELTTGLDARARRDVWKILEILKQQGLSILLTSHFMDEIEALCDEICIIKKGKMVYRGTVQNAVVESKCDKFEDAYLWFTDDDTVNEELLIKEI